jgi:hypothetical protein
MKIPLLVLTATVLLLNSCRVLDSTYSDKFDKFLREDLRKPWVSERTAAALSSSQEVLVIRLDKNNAERVFVGSGTSVKELLDKLGSGPSIGEAEIRVIKEWSVSRLGLPFDPKNAAWNSKVYQTILSPGDVIVIPRLQ